MRVRAAVVTNSTDRQIVVKTTGGQDLTIPPGESVKNVEIWESQCSELSKTLGVSVRQRLED